MSEVQPQGKLNDARAIVWTHNQTECTAIRRKPIREISVRITPSRAVEHVEHVRPELE